MHHTYVTSTPTPVLCTHVPVMPTTLEDSLHPRPAHAYPHHHASVHRCHTLYTPLGPALHTYVPPSHLYPYAHTGPCRACHTRSPPAHMVITMSYIYPHRHASAYRCLPMPCTLHTPEPTPCTNTCLPSPLNPVLCPHRSLPHSKIACTHDHHMATHIGMPLPIGDFPCHAL